MKITDLLTDINIEVLRLIAANTDSKVVNQTNNMDSSLKKFKNMFDSLRLKASELDNSLGFFEKRELKSELKALMKMMQNSKTDNQWKVLEASSIVSKLCFKYHAEIVHNEFQSTGAKSVSEIIKQEDYNPGFKDRIVAAFKSAEAKKAKYGIRADEPDIIIDVSEVNEAVERASRIDSAIARKRAEKQEQDERAAKISAAIERKRAIQIRDFESDNDKKGEKVSIRYEYQNDTYYLDGNPVLKKPRRLITSKEKEAYIKSKLHNQFEFGYLFNRFAQDDMKLLKNCDPYIIELLLSKDIRLARDYIKQMAGNPYERMSPQEFSVVYDVRGLESNKGYISSKERRGIRKMAKQQRKSAKVLEDKRKLPWYAAIPVIGALAVGTIAGITASNNSNQSNDKNILSDNSYSDTLEPGTTTETTHTTTTTMSATETTTTITTASSKVDEKENIDDGSHKDNRKDDIQEVKTIINIGDKIMVQDGLEYTADCLGGGNSNKIGAVSWRPATEYNVEKVAFIYQGRALKIMNKGDLDVEQTLTDIASQNGISSEDITTSVLISLVPGTADTGWVNISIEDMKQNISKPVEEQSSMISHIDFDFDR